MAEPDNREFPENERYDRRVRDRRVKVVRDEEIIDFVRMTVEQLNILADRLERFISVSEQIDKDD
jgi:hypothetical protein